MKKIYRISPVWIIVFLWFVFCAPFFFLGKTPYASTYQVNFFPPWSSYSQFASPVKNNAQPDIISQIYPWRYLAINEIKKGQFPFWNPYDFSGTPLLANYQSAVLNPLNLLFFLPFSFINIWSFLVLLQPLLAGIFMYVFERSLKISKSGSLVSSISFMFCGFITTWMGYGTLGFAILPLPLTLFAIEKYRLYKKYRYQVLLALCLTFSFFAGHFQTSIYLTLSVFLYIIYHLIFFKEKKEMFLCLFFVICGILLAMPQILPTFEFYTQSLRSALFQKLEVIPWNYLPTIFAPDFYGNPVTRNDWFGHYAEWNAYSGTIGISLALFSVFFRRNRKNLFFILLAVLSLLLSYNTPLINLIVNLKIPVLATSAFSRIIVLFSFSIAVLAGYGLDGLVERLSKGKRSVIIWMVGIVLIIFLIVLSTIFLPNEFRSVSRKNLIIPILTLIIFFVVVILRLTFKNKGFLKTFLVITVVLTMFEMYRFATKWQAFDPKSLAYSNVPITRFLDKNFKGERFFADFGATVSDYYKLPIAGGYDPLYSQRYGEFIQSIDDGKVEEGQRSVVSFPKRGKYTPIAINFLGMRYFIRKISDGEASWAFPYSQYPPQQFTKIFDDLHYQVFVNHFSYPRVFLVPKVSKISDKQKIVDFMFANNLRDNATVEQSLALDRNATGSAKIVKYTPNKVIVEARSSGKMLLVLTDNFYPGWSVKVNGEKEQILRTDYTFRGVVVPRGKSTVEFDYLPQSFLLGLYLALIGLLFMVANWVFGYFKKI